MKKLLTIATVTLVSAWCIVVLLSWLLSAMMVDGVRPLLSGEGIRWLFAHFAEGLASPVLVWMLLASMAGGCVAGSRLFMSGGNYRRKAALRVAAVSLVLYVAAIALLTLPPYAVLLSATGTLASSPFSSALVPVACLGVTIFSVVYAIVAQTMSSPGDIIDAMVMGIRAAAPLLFLYVVAAQFVQTLLYVLG